MPEPHQCLFCSIVEGETDAAMDFLERVFALGFGKRDWIVNDPDYAILAPEPRFQQWLGRLK